MNATWIIVIAAVALVASAGSISLWTGARASRRPVNPEQLARLRDARPRAEQVDERVTEEHEARRRAPQPTRMQAWAFGV